MKFYNRDKELAELRKVSEQTKTAAKMTVLTGRRRVGKTMLALEFARNQPFIYLFVSKKSEPLLCAEFLDEIKKDVALPVIGEIRAFKDIFALLLQVAQDNELTLIVDEFQEFANINPAVFSEIQNLWDRQKNDSRLNVIFIGSIHSMIIRIFQNAKEPLFGRADRIIRLRPFNIPTLKAILYDHEIRELQTLFDYYVFTGGMPKYIDAFITNGCASFQSLLDFMVQQDSPFIDEGRNLLIEEFGRDYGSYFSILELIAVGKTTRAEIESILQRPVGGYLERLENEYALIAKYKPINAKPNARLQRFRITDNFLNLWFRFVHRNRTAVETGSFSYIKSVLQRDYQTYCGKLLEKFFHELFAQTGEYNRLGSYWERGGQNEIDLVAINDMQKKIVMAEVKLNKRKINLNALHQKANHLLASYSNYTPSFLALSLEDATKYLP
ncbi:MAG: ATP-binding protein [bacterium]